MKNREKKCQEYKRPQDKTSSEDCKDFFSGVRGIIPRSPVLHFPKERQKNKLLKFFGFGGTDILVCEV